ncbi:hypothetical protein CDD82_6997 [Ophiocordyceps australis]|uniref:Manganese/iron superoxide dismutase C-terminal domain-containing protein n=1 Tax=Ophiocordyceps australis TaxID=1399860 RepID=A0A2C5XXR8_9HYPO|nr:hypothetical protein CDD82_6997 [Ophiocordyceps australis]
MLRTRLRLPRRSFGLAAAGASLNCASLNCASFNARRCLHRVPKLAHDFSNGIPELMSPVGFQYAWTDYMQFVLEKLNLLTEGGELENRDTKSTLLLTAREPKQAAIFNYASMAHNHHFFFSTITPTGTPMPDDLREHLETSFSSLETLRREFILTADVMFGPGFVWLVKAGDNSYRLVNTYLAGSPYSGAHWRAQPQDLNTLGSSGSARTFIEKTAAADTSKPPTPPGGIHVEPVLCLSTWQHVWLLDWGIGVGGRGGKLAFAEAWWTRIDWEQVAERAGIYRPKKKTAAASS